MRSPWASKLGEPLLRFRRSIWRASDQQAIVESPAEQGRRKRCMRRLLHRFADFIAVADAALRAGKEAVEFRPGVVPQHAGVDARPAGQIKPALRGQGQGSRNRRSPYCRCARRLGYAVGRLLGSRKPEIPRIAAMADGSAASEGAERTRLAEESAAQAFTRPLGDDGNHAADGIRTPERRLRAAQNFDPLDVCGIQAGEVEAAARRRRVVDRHAVDQHQRLIAGGAADTHGGGTPKAPFWLIVTPGVVAMASSA